MKYKLFGLVTALALSVAVSGFMSPQTYAVDCANAGASGTDESTTANCETICEGNNAQAKAAARCDDYNKAKAEAAKQPLNKVSGSSDKGPGCIVLTFLPGCAGNQSANGDPIASIIATLINWLTIGVGFAAVGAFVYAGILYSSAGGSSELISKSKTIMMNTVIGLVVFGLMFFIIQWLLPGDIIG